MPFLCVEACSDGRTPVEELAAATALGANEIGGNGLPYCVGWPLRFVDYSTGPGPPYCHARSLRDPVNRRLNHFRNRTLNSGRVQRTKCWVAASLNGADMYPGQKLLREHPQCEDRCGRGMTIKQNARGMQEFVVRHRAEPTRPCHTRPTRSQVAFYLLAIEVADARSLSSQSIVSGCDPSRVEGLLIDR